MDIADETFARVPAATLAAIVADPRSWRLWWPDLEPAVTKDRGVKGQQWALGGALRGTMEVWLEAVAGGTVIHWYLRADPTALVPPRRRRRVREDRVLAWKAHMFALKDRLEALEHVKVRVGPAESI